ncbi:MAG: shikimate kinase [Actinomycetes bacterium]
MSDQRVLLVGMMGVGKSAVGRVIAERTGWPYVDNDDLLHENTGLYGADLLERDGVDALRDAEAEALSEILQHDPPLVAGVAAGVVLREHDRGRLKNGGVVVWLRARTETLVARIGNDRDRAWLQPEPAAALRALAEGRDPLYAGISDLTIDVDDRSPDEIAQQVIDALPRLSTPCSGS